MERSIHFYIRLFLILNLFFIQINKADAKHIYEFDDQQDTASVKKDGSPEKKAAGAVKDGKKIKNSLLKKIANLLKLKKNATERERKRIIDLIDTMNIGIIDTTDIAGAGTIKAEINTLWGLVTDISKSDTLLYRELLNHITTALEAQTAKTTKTADLATQAAQQAQATFALITAKMSELPVPPFNDTVPDPLQIKMDTKEQQGSLQVIRSLLKPDSSGKNNDVNTRFQLHKKAAVHAFCNTSGYHDYSTTRFDLYDAFVFDSLVLNGSSGFVSGTINEQIFSSAKKAGCKVYFTISADLNNGTAFLKSKTAQQYFIRSCSALLKQYGANGINFRFNNLQPAERQDFASMLVNVSGQLQQLYPGCRISLTLPAFQQGVYDVEAIDRFITYYYIDFTTIASPGQAAPLAPVTGFKNNNLTTSLAYYLNLQVPAAKFIVNLPYRGTVWTLYPGPKKREVFIRYITYAEIRQLLNWPVQYDQSMSAYMDIPYKHVITRRIWFDDENTLAQKYDQVLQNGLGGVGISYLGNDGSFGELTDMLLYKFFRPDTLNKTDSSTNVKTGFWRRLSCRLTLYKYILNNPCGICFENVAGDDEWSNIHTSLQDLGLGGMDNKAQFVFLNEELNRVTLYISLSLLLITGIIAYVYIYNLKNAGDGWRHKKPVAVTLAALIILLIWSVFIYLFTNDLIPIFGVSNNFSEPHKDTTSTIASLQTFPGLDTAGSNIAQQQLFENSITQPTSESVTDCQPDKDCINIPFHTLMGVILFGVVIGLLVGRYLIAPILKEDKVP